MEKILFTIEDASQMTGLSKSSLYKLTASRIISFYKPFGKKIFFSMEQLEQMMKKVRIRSIEEITNEQIKKEV
jgi:excisionase family DNA binding protein